MKQIFLGAIIVLVVFSCRTKIQDSEERRTKEDLSGFDQMKEMKDIYYRFPSPDEMLNFIDTEELTFDDLALLPDDYARNYLDSKSQALNLGIYSADLAYITLFQRQKEALTYFTVVYGLSEKLRVSSAFDPVLMQRFEQNLKNADSLKSLTDEAMTSITDYLVKNDKEKTFAIISIGGFVESMYLSFHLVDVYSEHSQIVQRISDQKLVLDNLIKYALEFEDDRNVKDAIELLNPIQQAFNELSTVSEETSVRKAEDGKLIIEGGEKITITEEQFYKLKEITHETRDIITKNLEN